VTHNCDGCNLCQVFDCPHCGSDNWHAQGVIDCGLSGLEMVGHCYDCGHMWWPVTEPDVTR